MLVRKEELLGNPDGQLIPGRPEYRDGLLSTISTEEDRRNDLLIQVDTLRREVREGSEKRQELLDRLKETTEQLAAAEGDQITQAPQVGQSPTPASLSPPGCQRSSLPPTSSTRYNVEHRNRTVP